MYNNGILFDRSFCDGERDLAMKDDDSDSTFEDSFQAFEIPAKALTRKTSGKS